LRRSNIRQLIDSVKSGCHLCNVLLEALPERIVADIDGGSFKGTYQLQAKPDISGWTLCIFLKCPHLSNYGFPSDGIREDLPLMVLREVTEEFGTKRPVWTLDTNRQGAPFRWMLSRRRLLAT
jgi:hypothetical protein